LILCGTLTEREASLAFLLVPLGEVVSISMLSVMERSDFTHANRALLLYIYSIKGEVPNSMKLSQMHKDFVTVFWTGKTEVFATRCQCQGERE
jgi:hypothetical protein